MVVVVDDENHYLDLVPRDEGNLVYYSVVREKVEALLAEYNNPIHTNTELLSKIRQGLRDLLNTEREQGSGLSEEDKKTVQDKVRAVLGKKE